MHYPPQPVQQPRIPLWVPGIWPRKKSMQRILKCDGILPEKHGPDGKPEDITPAEVRAIKTFVEANRTLTTPFDIVISGKTGEMSLAHQQDLMSSWADAGATWWVEALWGESEKEVIQRIRQGPPSDKTVPLEGGD